MNCVGTKAVVSPAVIIVLVVALIVVLVVALIITTGPAPWLIDAGFYAELLSVHLLFLFVASMDFFNDCLNGCAVWILGTVSFAVLLNIVSKSFTVEISVVACKAELPLCILWKANEFCKSVSSWPLSIRDESNESWVK